MKPPAAAATLAEVRREQKNERLLNNGKTCITSKNMQSDTDKIVNCTV